MVRQRRAAISRDYTNAEKDALKSATALFNVLKEKFKPQHKEMMLSLQYCRLQRKENETAKSE